MKTNHHTRAARNLARPLPSITTQPSAAAIRWILAAVASLLALAVAILTA